MIDGLGESDRRAQGDLFAKLARDLLVKEMEEPSKITTIRKWFACGGASCSLMLIRGTARLVGKGVCGR
jgi:hypothetical protein